MIGAMSTPAMPPMPALIAHVSEKIRLTLTPMSRAAVWLCAVARIAMPVLVRLKNRYRASMMTREEPITPTSIAVKLKMPSRMGSLEKIVGSGSTS